MEKTNDKTEWLAQVEEEVLEPERPIIDTHHHLWRHRPSPYYPLTYMLEDFRRDTGSGHNVKKTVYVECAVEYREGGDEDLRPVGETEFAQDLADQSRDGGPGAPPIAAIVGHVDLSIGAKAGEVLDAHRQAAPELFRGIRHSGAWDAYENLRGSHSNARENLYLEPAFREGFRELASRSLTFDAVIFFHSFAKLIDLARANPDVTIILDHLGCPLGVGPYRGKRDEVFAQWKAGITALAACENVFAKMGGLCLPANGFDWHKQERPPTSDALVEAQGAYYHHTIDVFGPERCMLESNFPIEKASVSYRVIWNAFKKIAARYAEDEKHALFYGTAARVYGLET